MSLKSRSDDSLRQLVYALSFKIHSLSTAMTAEELTRTIRSCYKLSCDNREVNLLLSELSRQVDKCTENFTDAQLELCHIGLRNMRKGFPSRRSRSESSNVDVAGGVVGDWLGESDNLDMLKMALSKQEEKVTRIRTLSNSGTDGSHLGLSYGENKVGYVAELESDVEDDLGDDQ